MGNRSPEHDKVKVKTGRRGVAIGATAGLAIAVGAALGSVALYGSRGAPDNGPQVAAARSCAATPALGAAIEPHLTGDVAAMLVRDTPENLSALTFNDGSGTAITMADTGGRLRLVNLWATWCAPCREEMPWLEALQVARGGGDFEVVAISVDGGSDDKPRAFLDEIGVDDLAFYHDPTIGVFNDLRREGLALGLPVTLLIDDDDCVIANMNGPAHWASPDAFALIDAALAARAGG